MTTITINEKIDLSKENFDNIEELYLEIQKQLNFENELQIKAEESKNLDESELISI